MIINIIYNAHLFFGEFIFDFVSAQGSAEVAWRVGKDYGGLQSFGGEIDMGYYG